MHHFTQPVEDRRKVDIYKERHPMETLKNKVAVVTGGTRGLGFGIAKAFIREGASVVIASRSNQNVQHALEQLRSISEKCAGFPCDISNLADTQALADFTVENFGKFDIWINNAGISCPTGPSVHVPPQMVTDLIQTNIIGTYYGSRTAMRQFLMQGNGKLINIIGKGARSPVPLHNAYASSRAWVHNYTLALAKEYKATQIGVFLLNPGLVETDMLQHLHFIEGYEHLVSTLRIVARILAKPPEFAASKAVWLASSATDSRTGLHISTLGMGAVLGGVGREGMRILLRKEPPPFNPRIDVIEPAVDIRLPSKTKNGRHKPQKLEKWVHSFEQKKVPATIGGKATNLRILQQKKFLIPKTHVISWDAHLFYLQHGKAAIERLRQEIETILEPGRMYAVRSSANIEDHAKQSFAGLFQTVLNVQSNEQVLEAIQHIWDTASSETITDYSQKEEGENEQTLMAVILQEMIQPVISGVSFSRNPITTLDEVVIEAVAGLGTQLVQEGHTPFRWINKWGSWVEKPASSPIPNEIIERVAQETRQISKTVKRDVDLEWVYDGQTLYWVQMRDITTLAKENIYSNKISKEMTPGLIKPLVWSVTVPIPAGVWIDFFTQILGRAPADPKSLAKAIHYRSYHNIGVFGKIFESLGMPRESLEIMLGVAPKDAGKPPFKPPMKTLRFLPRILLFLYDKWVFGKKAERDYALLASEARQYPIPPTTSFSIAQILHEIDKIGNLNKKTTYNTILSILLMQFYNRMLGALLKSTGIDFQNFDLTQGMDELKLYDPSHSLAALYDEFVSLDHVVQEKIRSRQLDPDFAPPEGEKFIQSFDAFMLEFGHMSDATGDFGSTPWRETPELILNLIANYEKPPEPSGEKAIYSQIERKGIKGWAIGLFYKRARQFRLLREKYSSIYTYTLMLFRAYYIALGECIAAEGLIEGKGDIFYLFDEEVRDYINAETDGSQFNKLIAKRKDEMELAKNITMPQIVFGEKHPPLILSIGEKLSGTPTSRGYYSGKVKVIQGIADFPKLEKGDVLVIPYSDVGWIPLFAKAGAVIAESGGILSHSSIIAREYNIPAVVSVSGALSLCDDTMVSIDGYKGEIMVHTLDSEITQNN
jgi:NAD(P)-dependent dehydrogenase (short-subunit alcohol dehydrogenase family)/phosphohistidine swiveling domain-containing protein